MVKLTCVYFTLNPKCHHSVRVVALWEISDIRGGIAGHSGRGRVGGRLTHGDDGGPIAGQAGEAAGGWRATAAWIVARDRAGGEWLVDITGATMLGRTNVFTDFGGNPVIRPQNSLHWCLLSVGEIYHA